MVSSPLRVLAAALLMLPGWVWADHLHRHAHSGTAAGQLIQPQMYLSTRWAREASHIASLDKARFGSSINNNGAFTSEQNYINFMWKNPRDEEENSSVADGGELSIGQYIGLFGKSSRELSGYPFSSLISGEEQQQLVRSYEVGMSVRASEVMSLNIKWDLYAQGDDNSLPNLYFKEPWKDRNALGAGIRFGF